jgi:hypothetical protein
VSYDKAVFIGIQENEPEDNLIEWEPPPRRVITREQYELEGGPFKRYNAYVRNMRAIGVDLGCNHHYGMGHFWHNPAMEPPCRIVKIGRQWHLRKSCAHIPPVAEWGDDPK